MTQLTFKERLALKTAAMQPQAAEPAVEKVNPAPRRFGQPKTEPTPAPEVKTDANPTNGLSNAGAENPSASEQPSRAPSRFGGGFKKSIQADPVIEEQAESKGPLEKEESPGPLPKVIQAYNEVGGASKEVVTEGELLSGHEGTEVVRKIKEKIVDLGFADNETALKDEMQKLQGMLVANPAACLYLLDEDLGLAVQALRKMTNNRVATDLAQAKPTKASKATATPALSLEDMKNALDLL